MTAALLRSVVRRLGQSAGAHKFREYTDGKLLELFLLDHDGLALELLIRRRAPMVFGVCRRLLRHEQDIEDAFQATFLALVREARTIRSRDSVGPWLYRVAYRIALRARARASRAHLPLEMDPPETPAAEEAARRELQPILDQEVNALPAKYRAAFVLCYIERMTTEEAARELGSPRGTVLSRLSRARDRLRRQLARRGFAPSSAALTGLPLAGIFERFAHAALLNSTTRAASAAAAGRPISAITSARVAELLFGAAQP